jgi:hypothetical protein
VAEGAGNHGVELAFGPGERLTFEREVLFPLAGLDPALAATNDALRTARRDLSLARIVVAAEYLDGRLDRPGAVAALRRTQLLSPERAEQVVSFFDDYRSYVVNYGLGEQRVRAAVQAAGSEEQARWAALRGILSEPTLPADL